MKRVTLFILGLLLFSTNTLAHHNSASSSGTSSRYVLVNGVNLTKPASQAYFVYDLARLDNAIGNLHTWVLGGEWAFSRHASLLASVPVVFLDHNFSGKSAGLGDASLGGKMLIANNARLLSFVQAGFIFPTGNDSAGLGSGSFAGELSIFGGLKIHDWLIFVAPAISSAFNSDPEPTVTGSVGVATPTYFKRLFFSLSVLPQVYAASSVFDDGSFKIYVEPQVGFFVDKRRSLSASLSTRVAVIDELSRATGVTLTQTDHALQSDVLWGLKLVLNYSFN